MHTTQPSVFLTAQWRHIVMLNFPVDPAVLAAYLPQGTEIDFWNGRTFLSVVGFRFEQTKVLGLPVPFHRDFDEVNLRFYVRQREGSESRRGVAFIKEIVPRRLIACVARRAYNENYVALPMRSRIELPTPPSQAGRVSYGWRLGSRWHEVAAEIAGRPAEPVAGSEEEFITEHYWGYARQRGGGTLAYQVEHPRWRVWTASDARLDCDVAAVYTPEFAPFLCGQPSSAFVAEGSAVAVRQGNRVG